jgi:Prolyl oligopeptidase family
VAAARHLAKSGEADPDRLGIRGGSAGGWTALAAVTTGTAGGAVFSAATSYYGVSDLRGLARATHDFESRYLDGLVGPLPGFEGVYTERAPIGHVTDATCPILLLQGLDDPVVPPEQSQAIAKELAAHGIRHAYIAFEGESHGFRKAETVMACLDAELTFYGDIFGFKTPGVPEVKLTGGKPGQRPQAGAKGKRPGSTGQPAAAAANPAKNSESTGPAAESTSKNTEGAGSAGGSGAGAKAAGEPGAGPDAAARAAGNGGRHRRR